MDDITGIEKRISQLNQEIADPKLDWREKAKNQGELSHLNIQLSLAAREFGKQLRAGKPSSLGPRVNKPIPHPRK